MVFYESPYRLVKTLDELGHTFWSGTGSMRFKGIKQDI